MNSQKTNSTRRRPAGTLAAALWQRACEFDHIHPDSTFPVFSGMNPYSAAYHLLMLSVGGFRGGFPMVGRAERT